MINKINVSGKNSFKLVIFFTCLSVFNFAAVLDNPIDTAHQQETTVNAPQDTNTESHESAAEGADHGKTSQPVNISKIAFEHILDSHSWHLWGEGHDAVSMALPVILKTDNGFVTFMSSEFHHDTHGMVVVEKNGQSFIN
jgi:hypothetical protein